MRRALVKVYAALHPAGPESLAALRAACACALGGKDWLEGEGEGEDWLSLDDAMLRISFEGLYFPLPEAVEALEATLPPQAAGKVDYLDLEDWTLTRCVFDRGVCRPSTRSLNHVLDYSGH